MCPLSANIYKYIPNRLYIVTIRAKSIRRTTTVMYKKVFSNKRFYIIALILLTTIAFILRARCCFWGYPLRLDPDEQATVENAIDLLLRHSWQANTYFWPNHLNIKCDALIFSLASRIIYHKPAYEAIREHELSFYLMARFFTTLFGAAMVPLIMTFVGILASEFDTGYRHFMQICAGLFATFLTTFILHSSFATPDIGLGFFLLLFAYNLMIYASEGRDRSLYTCTILAGMGITIKYSAASLIIPLAVVVIYRAIALDKKPLKIIRYALTCAAIVTITVFVISPNLFTNYDVVFAELKHNARSTHLSADGLGFFGNLRYYFEDISSNMGYITIVPFIFGLIYILKHHNRRLLSLLTGLNYWICISVLGLHWPRWGVPIYPFYIIITTLGMGYLIQFIKRATNENRLTRCIYPAVSVAYMLILFNAIISGAAITKYFSLPDTRVSGLAPLNDYGINEQNTLIEGYTPLAPYTAEQQINSFTISGDGIKPISEYADKKFFMKSDNFSDRYRKEPDRYKSQIEVYDAIDRTFEIVFRIVPDGNYEVDGNLITNIKNSILYLSQEKHSTGCTITVYDLHSRCNQSE